MSNKKCHLLKPLQVKYFVTILNLDAEIILRWTVSSLLFGL